MKVKLKLKKLTKLEKNKSSKLLISFEELKAKMNYFISESDKLVKKEFLINNKDSVDDKVEKVLNWKEEVHKFLKESIDGENDKFLDIFNLRNINNWPEYMIKISSSSDAENLIFIIEEGNRNINYLAEILEMVDHFRDSERKINITSIQEKNDFILQKLYSLFNDKFYSVEDILNLNDIKYRSNEPNEICSELKRKKYIVTSSFGGENAQLTIKGASYVERLLKTNSKKSKEKNNLYIEGRIDDVIFQLTKLGYGQEIIFTELEELKHQHKKLSKKSWSQLLKGKLIDLGISQAINKETLSYVYEFLVDEKFKLPQ